MIDIRISNQVGKALDIGWKVIALPMTGMPMRKIARMSRLFALAEPCPVDSRELDNQIVQPAFL